MTDKEYEAYFDRLMGVEGVSGLNFECDLYQHFITGVAKCCIFVRNLKCIDKKADSIHSSKYVEVPVSEKFVPWSMQSPICEDPGELDEPENF